MLTLVRGQCRNPQQIRPGLYLVEFTYAKKITARTVFRPYLVVLDDDGKYVPRAHVIPSKKSYRKGDFEVYFWPASGSYVRGAFPTEPEAIAFMLHAAGHLFP